MRSKVEVRNIMATGPKTPALSRRCFSARLALDKVSTIRNIHTRALSQSPHSQSVRPYIHPRTSGVQPILLLLTPAYHAPPPRSSIHDSVSHSRLSNLQACSTADRPHQKRRYYYDRLYSVSANAPRGCLTTTPHSASRTGACSKRRKRWSWRPRGTSA